MADLEIKIEGLNELKKELSQFPEQLQKKALDKAVRAGSRLIVKAARDKAPKRANEWEGIKYPNPPGTLKKGIKAEKARRMPAYFRRDIIGFSPVAWYGALVERGHKIVRGDKTIGHVAAKPFLRPAFDENLNKAIDAMKEQLGKEIGKIKMNYIKAE